MIGYLTFDELNQNEEDGTGGVKRMKEALQEREIERNQRKRSGVSEAWVWHDEDELLAYEDLLEDFHKRYKSSYSKKSNYFEGEEKQASILL